MTAVKKVRDFVRVNGWYLFAEELWSRSTCRTRSALLARRLKTEGLYIGRYPQIRGACFFQVGKNFHAGDSLWMEAVGKYKGQTFQPRIVIGEGVRASNWVHIAATCYVEIGDHCLIGSKVIITDHGHGQYTGSHSSPHESPAERQLDSNRRVIIGSKVWLGDGVAVMPGVQIGEGAVVGANSVVSRDIPPYTLAIGAPARPVKRFDFSLRTWIQI